MSTSQYWETTYSREQGDSPITTAPSTFVCDIYSYLSETDVVLELGCGNGRDARYIASRVKSYVGVDASTEAVSYCEKTCVAENARFVQGYMPNDIPDLVCTPSVVYSRFSLHSINDSDIETTVSNVSKKLPDGGLFAVEARSVHDPRCGRGTQVGPNAWIDTHYRNFLVMSSFLGLVEKHGFHVKQMCEEYRRAWYKSDKAVVIRMIAVKRKAVI